MKKKRLTAASRPRIDVHRVDLPALFGDLIRERTLYGVLEGLAVACCNRARSCGEQSAIQDGISKEYRENEELFYFQASDEIDRVVSFLRLEWKDDAPVSADGDMNRWMRWVHGTARKSLLDQVQQLATLFEDSEASLHARHEAVAAFARSLEGTTWICNETGAPDFQVGRELHQLAMDLTRPTMPAQERRESLEFFKKFIAR